MTLTATRYYDVYWEGPYQEDELVEVHKNNVLYMICGTHGLYGRNVPLYIGKTEQEVYVRIKQHAHWIDHEPDPVNFYVACIAEFESWGARDMIEEYPPLGREIIEQVESLLIYAHQPVYNSRSKQCNFKTLGKITLFNTGRRSTLYPEVSSLRWVGDDA